MKIRFKSNFVFPTRYKYTIRHRHYLKGQVKWVKDITPLCSFAIDQRTCKFSTIEFLGTGELRGVNNAVFEVCKD